MLKRGSAGFVLVSILIVAAVGVLFLVSEKSSPTGMVFLSRGIINPPVVNPYGNQQVNLPYSNRGSSYQYIYAPSYGAPKQLRMSMLDCQTFCFGRPESFDRDKYPKYEYGGQRLRACLAECEEQRLGITDTTEHNWHYDTVRFDRPMYYKVGLR